MSGTNSPTSLTCGWVLFPELLSSAMEELQLPDSLTPRCTRILSGNWEWKQRTDMTQSVVEMLGGDSVEGSWTKTTVPTEIFRDLLGAGVIEDPHLGMNEKDVKWVGEVDWLYRTFFDIAPPSDDRRKIVLVFEGLDTFAQIHLNGSLILKSEVIHVRDTLTSEYVSRTSR